MGIWPVILGVGILVAVMLLFNQYIVMMKKKKLLFDIGESVKINPLKFIYKKVDRRNLGLDVYLPENHSEAQFPAVIFIHGEGPFINDAKDWTILTSYGRLLAGMGFAGITFNHRGAGLNWLKIDDAATDILDAIGFVRKNAAAWNVDENRICVWAFSAGGIYLSLFLKDHLDGVKCLVSFYGLLDLRTWVKDLPEALTEYTPEQYLTAGGARPPFLIVKAAKDIRRINDAVASFIQRADEKKVNYELLVHSSGRHAFDALDDNQETRDIIKRTLEFIKENT
ncbi:MAG TPA: alpha/beta hydrolase [Bacillota bacterium]|nr:alpha/beta hydrolase [Bacillota bacterium]